MRNGDPSRRDLAHSEPSARGSTQGGGGRPAEILDLRQAQRRRRAEAASPATPTTATPATTTSPGATDGAPFWEIWQANREHLMRQSLRLMAGNQADAEDALSTAMLRASQRFDRYADEIVNQRAWLTRLLHNACMDLYRGYSRRATQRLPGDRPEGEQADPLPGLAAEESSPEEIAEGREALRLLQERVAALPPSLRLPLLLRFVHDRSYQEIAEQLALTNCAVRKRIQLARERLRRELEG